MGVGLEGEAGGGVTLYYLHAPCHARMAGVEGEEGRLFSVLGSLLLAALLHLLPALTPSPFACLPCLLPTLVTVAWAVRGFYQMAISHPIQVIPLTPLPTTTPYYFQFLYISLPLWFVLLIVWLDMAGTLVSHFILPATFFFPGGAFLPHALALHAMPSLALDLVGPGLDIQDCLCLLLAPQPPCPPACLPACPVPPPPPGRGLPILFFPREGPVPANFFALPIPFLPCL